MPRKGRRKRIARAIYEDGNGRSGIYRDSLGRAREVRFPPHTPISEIRREIDARKAKGRGSGRLQADRGTLAHAVDRWEPLEQHLTGWKERRAELRAWVRLYGDKRMTAITEELVRRAVSFWATTPMETVKRPRPASAKTIRQRLWSLKHLYKVLYGPDASTPVDNVKPPAKVKRTPVYVPAKKILEVYQKLLEFEAQGLLRDTKTRARFMVRASTGRRPAEIMRAQPDDVDIERRTWKVRDGKGGWSTGIYLNDDIRNAWLVFIAAKAWGTFNTGSHAEVLRNAGWPSDRHPETGRYVSRPYDMRASTGISLSELGIDLADVGDWLGHTELQTTRSVYVPILGGRMQQASETLEGRLHGWAVPSPPPLSGLESLGITGDLPQSANGTKNRKSPGKPNKSRAKAGGSA